MPVAALPPYLWAATLRTVRELTRVAVTALVLIAGTTAPAAADSPAAAPATAGPVTVAPSRPADSLDARAIDGSTRLAAVDAGPILTGAWVAGTPRQAFPAGHPLAVAATPASGAPAHRADAAPATPGPAAAASATDPGRDALARRGPPRA